MIRKFWRYFEEITGSALLVGMCAVTTLQVLVVFTAKLKTHLTFLPSVKPLSWTEELTTILFVWMVFIGASLALKYSDHFAVEIIVQKAPRKIGKPLILFACVLVILFCLLLIYYGGTFMLSGGRSTTSAMGLPRYIPYAAVPFGGVIMLARAIELLIREIVRAQPEPIAENVTELGEGPQE